MMDRETLSTHGYARRHTPLCHPNQSQDWLPCRFSHLEGDQQRPGRKQTGHQARSQDTWASILVSLCNRKADLPPSPPLTPPPLDLTACPHSEVARTPSLCLFTTAGGGGEGGRQRHSRLYCGSETHSSPPPLWGFPLSKNSFLGLPWPPARPISLSARMPALSRGQ